MISISYKLPFFRRNFEICIDFSVNLSGVLRYRNCSVIGTVKNLSQLMINSLEVSGNHFQMFPLIDDILY